MIKPQPESKVFRHPLNRSFQFSLIIIYGLTAAATVFGFLWSLSGVSIQYVQRYAEAQCRLEVEKLQARINRELVLSQKMVDDPSIVDWLENYESTAREQLALRQIESYRRLFNDHTWFVANRKTDEFMVQSPETGGIRTTILDPDNPGDRWFYESLVQQKDFWINVNYDAVLDEVRVWVNALIKNSSGTPFGVAGAGMGLDVFLQEMTTNNEKGLTTVIVNGSNEIIASNDRTLTEYNARVSRDEDRITVFRHFQTSFDEDAIRKALHSLSGSTDYRNIIILSAKNNAPSVMAIAYMKNLDWYFLLTTDSQQIMDMKNFIPIVVIFIASLLIALSFINLILSRLVMKPLGVLTRGASKIAAGNYTVTIPHTRDDEIGNLGKTFTEMAAKINDYTQNLEKLVENRTRELSEANRALNESQARIIDSIEYGKLIQASITPGKDELARHLGEFFIYQQPLDMVGGDFCFFHELPGGFCIASIDCTGHGVPGAFMTMLVHGTLNHVIDAFPYSSPDVLLNQLDIMFRDSLRGENEVAHLHNGFDIALCVVRPEEKSIQFAGAGLPLYVAKHGVVMELTESKVHLGYSSRGKKNIQLHTLEYDTESYFYMITDGIWDLPDGRTGYGLGRQGLLRLLEEAQSIPLGEQDRHINKALDTFSGTSQAKDDRLMLRFRLKPLEGI